MRALFLARAWFASVFPAFYLWAVAALLVFLFCARFALRALGVRQDTPLSGFIYSITAPFVQPFYHFFPVSPRFDFNAYEAASLVAAGVVAAAALGLYALYLLASHYYPVLRGRRRASS
jgi:uncharacterized protein YggT (Ycf19 family)